MRRNTKFIISLVVIVCAAALVCFSFSQPRNISPTMSGDNSVSGITSDIRLHSPAILDVQVPASSTSFWVTHEGYMAIVPNQSKLQSYIDSPRDVDSLMKADQDLTAYASWRLTNAGYKPDQDNTSTSTDNVPFNTLRIAFVSSDGEFHCVIKPPDPTQAQLYISWSFACVNAKDIAEVVQNEMPFLQALGDLRGAAVTYETQGDFAAVGVFGEDLGYYNAVMIRSDAVWKVIFKGQEPPSCVLMQEYSVPKSIYGQCQ